MALVEAERALEHWATDEDSLDWQGAVIWRTAQVPCGSISDLSTGPRFAASQTALEDALQEAVFALLKHKCCCVAGSL